MEYLVGNKKVRYNPYNMKKDKCLGKGKEGSVYQIGTSAVKFYHPFCSKLRLNKEEVIFLSKINTKRILTPEKDKILLNKRRKLEGYGTKYIENLGLDNILELDSELLKDELNLIKEDVDLLSDNSVILADFIIENISFNNGIYIVDPGSFHPSKTIEPLTAYALNIEEVNEFLILQLLSTLTYYLTNKKEISRKVTQSIFHDYKEQSYPDLIEYLTDDIKEENLKEYIKIKGYK